MLGREVSCLKQRNFRHRLGWFFLVAMTCDELQPVHFRNFMLQWMDAFLSRFVSSTLGICKTASLAQTSLMKTGIFRRLFTFFRQWLDSNRTSLVSEETAEPTVPVDLLV